MRNCHKGENLTQDELNEIANNFSLTYHAKQRISERNKNVNLKQVILNPVLAYFNTDYSINIALNEYEYLVVVYKKYINKYLIITYKERSFNSITIFQKQELAKINYKRKV